MNRQILGLLFCAVIPSYASATEIKYDLSGLTTADITPGAGYERFVENNNKQVQVDWGGVVLTHFVNENRVGLKGRLTIGICDRGAQCITGNPTQLERIPGLGANGIYVGEEEFILDNRWGTFGFDLDTSITNGTEDIRASGDRYIGRIYSEDRRRVANFNLKEHPDLGYSFRLFDDGPEGDGLYRIAAWIPIDSWSLFRGAFRGETNPGEAIFNGDLFACRRGVGLACGGEPETEVPEPMSLLLLGGGLFAGALKRRITASC